MEQVQAAGTKVKGQYNGVPYTGVVREGRPHTLNSSYLHFVDLDKPITVYGMERNSVLISIWRSGRDAEFPMSIEAA